MRALKVFWLILVVTFFVSCTQKKIQVEKDVYKEQNITRPTLTPYELNKIADQIFRNETGGKLKYLMYWSPRENFASLGYGHFIWYPAGEPQKFDQTFPDMIDYYVKNGVKIPEWLKKQKDIGLPWSSRVEFEKARGSDKRFKELETILINTKALQTKFFFDRVVDAIPEIVQYVPRDRQKYIKKSYNAVANTTRWFGIL